MSNNYKVGDKLERLSTLTITEINHTTGVIKGINEVGAAVVITTVYADDMYVRLAKSLGEL